MITDFSSVTIAQFRDHSLVERLAFTAHRRETRLATAGALREHVTPAWTW
jgi:hypothetical protein